MRTQRDSVSPSTRRGSRPCSFLSPWWIPSWIALVWRSVLPEQIDEVVRVAEHAAQVELDDVDRLLVGRGLGDHSARRSWRAAVGLASSGALLMRWRCGPRRARGLRSRRRRRRARGSRIGRPSATRARRSVEEMSMRRHVEERHASSRRAAASSVCAICVARERRRARRPPAGPARRTSRGSRHAGRLVGHVAADDEGQLVLRALVMQLPQGIDRVRRARRARARASDTARRSSSADREPAQLEARAPRPGSSGDLLVRRHARRHEQHAVERRAGRAPPGRTRGAPRCGGLNVPPRMPTRATRPLRQRTWPSPSTRYLIRAQLAQADRPAGVELLRRVADLGAHAELAAVGEARRGVDVDAGRVDAALERARGAEVAVTIASEWPRAVAVDVLDRLLERVDDADGQHQREELGVPVLVGRVDAARRPARRRRARACARRRAARRPRRAARAARAGGTRRATSAWTSSVSAALQTPGRWVLALTTIALGGVEVGAGVDVDVAVARRGVDHRHRRDAPSAPPSGPRRRAG